MIRVHKQVFPPKLCRDREELARVYLNQREQRPGISWGALLWALALLGFGAVVFVRIVFALW